MDGGNQHRRLHFGKEDATGAQKSCGVPRRYVESTSPPRQHLVRRQHQPEVAGDRVAAQDVVELNGLRPRRERPAWRGDVRGKDPSVKEVQHFCTEDHAGADATAKRDRRAP